MLLLIAKFVEFCYDSTGNFGLQKKRKWACLAMNSFLLPVVLDKYTG